MSFAEKAGGFVADHPVFVAVTFAAILAGSVPVLMGVEVYMSIYELSPRGEYYDHFRVLNGELGWDNLGAVLMTLPADDSAGSVLEPAAIRHMHEVERELEKLDFVEGAFSMAKVVEILNSRPYFLLNDSLSGTPLGGVPDAPWPNDFPVSEADYNGFPPEGQAGDERINRTIELALSDRLPLRDQLYGNILHLDNQSALMVVMMKKGMTGEQYRTWQETLLERGLELDNHTSMQYRDELELRPLSIDIIYSTLDGVATDEGPYWIAAAVVAALGTVAFLFRRGVDLMSAVIVLIVVVSVTLAVANLQGVDFNMLSLLVAALIFGAGVDYAMHVIARYREERSLGYDTRKALLHTVRASGPALLITSVTTTGGFLSLYFSLIPAIGQFGIMVGAAIFMAFLVCLSLLPVLLVWADKMKARGEVQRVESEAEIERRRHQLEAKVREEQRNSTLGRFGLKVARNRRPVIIASLVGVLLMASPMLTYGVNVWGASYLDPYTIFDEETYPMQALIAMNDTFGIPNELGIVFYGDVTEPAAVAYLDRLQSATNDVHGRTKTDSVPNVLRLYTAIINPDPRIDREPRDGIPDSQADIKRAFDEMRADPATSILVNRVVVHSDDGYFVSAHRLGINPQPENSVGTDVDNYRKTVEDVEADLASLAADEREAGLRHGTTGLVVLATEVVDAIIRGNAASVAIMLVVVYAILFAFWRKPGLALIGMIPVVVAVIAQYSLMAVLGYEVTYVSLILTGMVMGIGVDDAVHYINRFREEIRNGRTPDEAATLASAEIGSVLVGTTVTTMAPFVAILWSVVTWATQTALLVLPTLIAALVVTLVTLPAVLSWHATVRPQAYRLMVPSERLMARAEESAGALLAKQ